MLQMCPSSERVSKVCTPHTVDTREMGVVHDEVMQIVIRQQERQEHILTQMHELRSAAYNQHDEVMRIVTRQQMLLEQMSTKLGIRWKDLETSLGKPKESLKTYVSTV